MEPLWSSPWCCPTVKHPTLSPMAECQTGAHSQMPTAGCPMARHWISWCHMGVPEPSREQELLPETSKLCVILPWPAGAR